MANNKARQNANTVAASIIAVLSVLDGVTPENVPSPRSLSITLNPFKFILGILQPIAGYDRIVKFVSELVVYGLSVIEDATKIALVEALKDMFSCSINPIIDKELINNGVVLDLKTIDLLNVMNRCPLDNENSLSKIKGSFFYSDVDYYTIPDQLVLCKDLNAVIWYVKHRATDRTVWYGYQTQGHEHASLTLDSKPCLEDGIITMEYAEKSSMLRDSQNNPLRVQVPYGNCLHVFLGNTKGVSPMPEPSFEDVLSKTQDFQQLSDSLTEVLDELESDIENAPTIEEQSALQCEINIVKMAKKALKDGVSLSTVLSDMMVDENTGKRYFNIEGKRIRMSEYTYTHNRDDLASENIVLDQHRNAHLQTYQYRKPEDNYYYHKTLFEFNTDYVMSVKFFDPKVVAAQIVNVLTGCFGISLNLSFEERLIRNEVEKILTKVIENHDIAISDCFFSFNNDEYNLMLDETEKERLGEYTGDDYAYGSKIDYDAIYDELNQVSSSATLSEEVTNFNRAMNEISRTIKPEIYSEEKEWELNFSFLNNILKGLTLSLVYNIISPKIYMLMAINLKVMGRDPNFDISKFIKLFKSLLVKVIRGIADKIIEQLKEWLISLVKDLVKRLADRLMFEQSEYYIRLLMKCLRALRQYLGGVNWNMADVEYADIYNDENNNDIEENQSC